MSKPNPFCRIGEGMAKKRVNITDPVRQVRLRVMWGNSHGFFLRTPWRRVL